MISGIVIRAVIAYVVLQLLVRSSGKMTIKQGSSLDFTVALVLGDIIDNAVWGEVGIAQFLVAAGTLFAAHIAVKAAGAARADAL
jgi:uncharacterized membrane protein YcaP (DUF421 family)